MKLTEALKKKLSRRLEEAMSDLGLEHWEIDLIVSDDPTPMEHASIHIVEGRKSAILTVYTKEVETFEEIYHWLHHELCHLLHNQITVLFNQWSQQIPEGSRGVYMDQWTEALEQLTENLNRILNNR